MVSRGDDQRIRIEAGDELRRLISELRPDRGGVIITVDGDEVARLEPFGEPRSRRPIDQVVDDIDAFASAHALNGLSWKDLRDEGRTR